MPKDHGYRAWFTAFEVLLPVKPAMVSVGNHHAHGLTVQSLAPISPIIDLTRVRIPRYHRIGSPYVGPAVQLVPKGHGKYVQVYLLALHHVLQNRGLVNNLRREIIGIPLP